MNQDVTPVRGTLQCVSVVHEKPFSTKLSRNCVNRAVATGLAVVSVEQCKVLLTTSFAYPKSTQVWLQLPGQDLEGCGLADSIGAHKSQHLPGAGCWQTMELKGVGTVPMGCVLFQVTWKVDDADGFKGTFLGIGRLIIWCSVTAYRAHPLTRVVLTFTQMPHPMHNCSEMVAILSAGVTSMHSLPAGRQGVYLTL